MNHKNYQNQNSGLSLSKALGSGVNGLNFSVSSNHQNPSHQAHYANTKYSTANSKNHYHNVQSQHISPHIPSTPQSTQYQTSNPALSNHGNAPGISSYHYQNSAQHMSQDIQNLNHSRHSHTGNSAYNAQHLTNHQNTSSASSLEFNQQVCQNAQNQSVNLFQNSSQNQNSHPNPTKNSNQSSLSYQSNVRCTAISGPNQSHKSTNLPQSSHVRVASVGNSSSGAAANEHEGREEFAYDFRLQNQMQQATRCQQESQGAGSKRLKMKSVGSSVTQQNSYTPEISPQLTSGGHKRASPPSGQSNGQIVQKGSQGQAAQFAFAPTAINNNSSQQDLTPSKQGQMMVAENAGESTAQILTNLQKKLIKLAGSQQGKSQTNFFAHLKQQVQSPRSPSALEAQKTGQFAQNGNYEAALLEQKSESNLSHGGQKMIKFLQRNTKNQKSPQLLPRGQNNQEMTENSENRSPNVQNCHKISQNQQVSSSQSNHLQTKQIGRYSAQNQQNHPDSSQLDLSSVVATFGVDDSRRLDQSQLSDLQNHSVVLKNQHKRIVDNENDDYSLMQNQKAPHSSAQQNQIQQSSGALQVRHSTSSKYVAQVSNFASQKQPQNLQISQNSEISHFSTNLPSKSPLSKQKGPKGTSPVPKSPFRPNIKSQQIQPTLPPPTQQQVQAHRLGQSGSKERQVSGAFVSISPNSRTTPTAKFGPSSSSNNCGIANQNSKFSEKRSTPLSRQIVGLKSSASHISIKNGNPNNSAIASSSGVYSRPAAATITPRQQAKQITTHSSTSASVAVVHCLTPAQSTPNLVKKLNVKQSKATIEVSKRQIVEKSSQVQKRALLAQSGQQAKENFVVQAACSSDQINNPPQQQQHLPMSTLMDSIDGTRAQQPSLSGSTVYQHQQSTNLVNNSAISASKGSIATSSTTVQQQQVSHTSRFQTTTPQKVPQKSPSQIVIKSSQAIKQFGNQQTSSSAGISKQQMYARQSSEVTKPKTTPLKSASIEPSTKVDRHHATSTSNIVVQQDAQQRYQNQSQAQKSVSKFDPKINTSSAQALNKQVYEHGKMVKGASSSRLVSSQQQGVPSQHQSSSSQNQSTKISTNIQQQHQQPMSSSRITHREKAKRENHQTSSNFATNKNQNHHHHRVESDNVYYQQMKSTSAIAAQKASQRMVSRGSTNSNKMRSSNNNRILSSSGTQSSTSLKDSSLGKSANGSAGLASKTAKAMIINQYLDNMQQAAALQSDKNSSQIKAKQGESGGASEVASGTQSKFNQRNGVRGGQQFVTNPEEHSQIGQNSHSAKVQDQNGKKDEAIANQTEVIENLRLFLQFLEKKGVINPTEVVQDGGKMNSLLTDIAKIDLKKFGSNSSKQKLKRLIRETSEQKRQARKNDLQMAQNQALVRKRMGTPVTTNKDDQERSSQIYQQNQQFQAQNASNVQQSVVLNQNLNQTRRHAGSSQGIHSSGQQSQKLNQLGPAENGGVLQNQRLIQQEQNQTDEPQSDQTNDANFSVNPANSTSNAASQRYISDSSCQGSVFAAGNSSKISAQLIRLQNQHNTDKNVPISRNPRHSNQAAQITNLASNQGSTSQYNQTSTTNTNTQGGAGRQMNYSNYQKVSVVQQQQKQNQHQLVHPHQQRKGNSAEPSISTHHNMINKNSSSKKIKFVSQNSNPNLANNNSAAQAKNNTNNYNQKQRRSSDGYLSQKNVTKNAQKTNQTTTNHLMSSTANSSQIQKQMVGKYQSSKRRGGSLDEGKKREVLRLSRGSSAKRTAKEIIGYLVPEEEQSGRVTGTILKERERLISYNKSHLRKRGTIPETSLEFYKFVKMIGKGAFGQVMLGIHKLTGRYVAIKAIDKSFMADAYSKQKVMQEVYILQKIRHSNIIRLYEVFQSPQHFFLVMEYVNGGDLLQFVKKQGHLPEETSKKIFKQIVHGLAHCHCRSVLHRDIKPDNILMDADGAIKICDFGVSRLITRSCTIQEQCGTPAYLAPEIIADQGYRGYYVDLWSLGVLLYAMLQGSVPYKASSLEDLLALILKDRLSFQVPISALAKDLIRRMLVIEPEKRISIPQILSHEWLKETFFETDLPCCEQEDQMELSQADGVMSSAAGVCGSLGSSNNPFSGFVQPSSSGQNHQTRFGDGYTTKSGEDSDLVNNQVSSCSEDQLNQQENLKKAGSRGKTQKETEFIEVEGGESMILTEQDTNPMHQIGNINVLDIKNLFHDQAQAGQSSNQSAKQESSSRQSDFASINKSGKGLTNKADSDSSKEAKMRISRDNYYAVTQDFGTHRIDEEALKVLEGFGYPRDSVIMSLHTGELNHATTTYNLLVTS